jgi:hypothetical protein
MHKELEQENTNLIDGQPVSEFGYLTYQFWKEERFRVFFILSLALFNAAIFISGGLVVVAFLSHHCEVKAYGSSP